MKNPLTHHEKPIRMDGIVHENKPQYGSNHNWLVGQGHPSEKYDFVNWDDDSNPIYWKIKNGNQTTNQETIF